MSMSTGIENLTVDLIDWIESYFDKNGPESPAIIGISGGKDSTVAAMLCSLALGPDRVIGVLMPNGEQSDLEDAKRIVEILGIKSYIVNIGEIYNALHKEIEKAGVQFNNIATINTPPRLRMSTLYAIANTCHGRVINTSNASERYIGYSTKYGDTAGDVSLFGNLYATEVVEIGKFLADTTASRRYWLNSLINVTQIERISELLKYVIKEPADGLTGKTDKENLGFSYEELDDYIIKRISTLPFETRKKINEMWKAGFHKTDPIPTFHI